jgi:hypothetical protein
MLAWLKSWFRRPAPIEPSGPLYHQAEWLRDFNDERLQGEHKATNRTAGRS